MLESPGVSGTSAGDERDPESADEEPVVDAAQAKRKLRNSLISLLILVAVVAGLLTAVPGLRGVAHAVARMNFAWVLGGIGLEMLSCLSYVLAFLQVFDRVPVRFGARVALSELAFGSAVSVGGAGSVAVGAWLLIERGRDPKRVAKRSAVLFLLTSAINVITLPSSASRCSSACSRGSEIGSSACCRGLSASRPSCSSSRLHRSSSVSLRPGPAVACARFCSRSRRASG